MRAASRAVLVLAVALSLAGVLPSTARAAARSGAEVSGPRCPAVVAGRPLSVTVPFSGTTRPRADDQGRIESTSLHCAYGEGAAPAAEVTVTWRAGTAPCATTEVAVAPSLDVAPFERLAADLAGVAGTNCGASSAGEWPRPAVAGGLVVGAGLVVLARRRRRPARTTTRALAEPVPAPAAERPPTVVVGPTGRLPVPDGGPVVAALRGPGGRDFAHSAAGQLAVLAAVAYGSGDRVTGDLARAGSLAVLPSGLLPRPEVAALAWGRAHQDVAGDR